MEYLVAAYGPEKLNDPAQAEPIVQQMIQMEPNEPTNYFALSKIYEDAGVTRRERPGQSQGRQAQGSDCSPRLRLLQPAGDFSKTMEPAPGRRPRPG
jgi:hypothetical protein